MEEAALFRLVASLAEVFVQWVWEKIARRDSFHSKGRTAGPSGACLVVCTDCSAEDSKNYALKIALDGMLGELIAPEVPVAALCEYAEVLVCGLSHKTRKKNNSVKNMFHLPLNSLFGTILSSRVTIQLEMNSVRNVFFLFQKHKC